MADIFISYSRQDAREAMTLVDTLRASGYSVWIDLGDLHGAANWTSEIVAALDSCQTVLFLISSRSITSENVSREIHLASEKKKRVLPVVLEEVEIPVHLQYPLAGIQRVLYSDSAAIAKSLQKLQVKEAVVEPIALPKVSKKIDDGAIHLAVLPFADLSPQHDNEWFADGMMDELISTLGSLNRLRVPSRTDVLYYRRHHLKAKDIADELGVRYLVEGSVRKAGDRIRIAATLTDTVVSHQLWSNKFDGSFDDIFDFQDSVSRQIVESLKLKLTPEEEEKVLSDPTQNAEAYEIYLKAVGYQHSFTKSGYENSLILLDEALALDPNFFDAYVSKSYSHSALYREYSREPRLLTEAESAIESAEKISGTTAMTLRARSEIAMLRGELTLAQNLIEQAIALEPPNSEVLYNLLGNIHSNLGRLDDAAIAFEKVLVIREDFEAYFNLLGILSRKAQDTKFVTLAEKAVACCEKHIRRNPGEVFPKLAYAYFLCWSGRISDAHLQAEKLLENQNLDATTLFNLGSLFDELGDPETNLKLIRRAILAGFRQIESLRSISYTIPEYSQELESLIKELEQVIEKEKVGA